MAPKEYRCTNAACPLGTPGKPGGRFVGGISKEQATMITGNPDPEHGAAVCPNCGQKGEPAPSAAEERKAALLEQREAINAELKEA